MRLGFSQATDDAEGRGAAIVAGLAGLASAVFYALAWVVLVFVLGGTG